MLFNSLLFIFAFLPVVLLAHSFMPARFRNLFLILASLVFYAWGEPVYLILMIFSMVLHYVMGLLLENEESSRKTILIFTVVMDVAILAFFKYAGAFTELLNDAFRLRISIGTLAFPVGLSFYTFRNLSYVLDIYQGKSQAERNFGMFAAYSSLFAVMSAGPIVRYGDISEGLRDRKLGISNIGAGAGRFIVGLGKKVLLADAMALLYSQIQNGGGQTVLSAWIALLAFTMQIYYDFSGYSDMAVGIGTMLGFRIPENFDHPYTAVSVTDFWRRWHISLSRWFRDYVYIPLGGNRVSVLRHIGNILAVWCLTGIWHGSTWNFILWGLYYGVLLIAEKYIYGKALAKLPRAAANIVTMFLVMIGWAFFANTTGAGLAENLGMLFGVGANGFADSAALYYLKNGLITFLVCIAGTGPRCHYLFDRYTREHRVAGVILYGVILLFGIAGLIFSSYRPFLYMQF